jgi:drug/metabolite transporter (DMT)-like permease
VAGVTGIGLGALCAIVASSLFSIGLVMQSVEAKKMSSEQALHLSLLLQLARRRGWLLGAGVMLVGFCFHVTAFLSAPLTVVQPALAAGLFVLLAYGLRTNAEPISRREIAGVTCIVVGVVGLALTSPVKAADEGGSSSIAISLAALGLVAIIPHGAALLRNRNGGGSASLLATLGAGAGYALTGLTTKLMADAITEGRLGVGVAWLALTAVVAALAFVDQNTALMGRGVVEVGPIVFVIPIVVPVLLAPLLVGEGWNNAPAGPVPLLISLVVVSVGAFVLSGSSRVAAAAS